jgi:hypothetical protein
MCLFDAVDLYFKNIDKKIYIFAGYFFDFSNVQTLGDFVQDADFFNNGFTFAPQRL